MPLDAATVLALAAVCAPDVAPSTLLAIARVESALDPLAIGVNGPGRRPERARSLAEAVRSAETLLARGASLDLGLTQINSRNLARLGLSLSDAFEPCASLRAAGDVLAADYRRASPPRDQQARLRVALSLYNTGHPERGFRNGYVSKVAAAAGIREPLLQRPVHTSAPALKVAGRVLSTPEGPGPFVLSFTSRGRP